MDFIHGCYGLLKANDTNSTVCRHLFKNSQRINHIAVVLQSQGRDVGVAWQNKFSQSRLIKQCQVCYSTGQMELLQDTTVGKCKSCDGSTVKVYFFNVSTAFNADRLLIFSKSKIRTVTDIKCLKQSVVAKVKLLKVFVGIGRRCITQLQSL